MELIQRSLDVTEIQMIAVMEQIWTRLAVVEMKVGEIRQFIDNKSNKKRIDKSFIGRNINSDKGSPLPILRFVSA